MYCIHVTRTHLYSEKGRQLPLLFIQCTNLHFPKIYCILFIFSETLHSVEYE